MVMLMQHKRNNLFGGLALLAALGLLAIGWTLGARQATQPEATTAATSENGEPLRTVAAPPLQDPTDASDSPPNAAQTSRSSSAMPPEPLPGALPPAELVAVLEPRARAGDAAAACRLALELAECRGTRHWRSPGEAELERQMARVDKDDPRQLAAMERRLNWYARQDQRKRECEALPEAVRDAGPQWMLQAAMQGNRGAMVGFAELQGVGGQELVANPALYAQYRQHAFPLWRQAFESGSVGALQVWMSALASNGFQFFAGVLPPDYQDLRLAQALMIEVQAALEVDPESNPVLPRIDAEIDEETARRARALFDRYYRDSPGLAAAEEQLKVLQEQIAMQRERPLQPEQEREYQAAQRNQRCSVDW